MTRQLMPCGTHAAYARHLKAREKPCQPCKDAANTKKKAERATHPGMVQSHRRYLAARGRALSRLAERYPDEMAGLLKEELGPGDSVRRPKKWKTP